MQSKLALSLSTILLLGGSSLHALKFETLGYKSVSMGGAAVASSAGSIATYNNPALLAKTPYGVEVSLGGGVSEYAKARGGVEILHVDAQQGGLVLLERACDRRGVRDRLAVGFLQRVDEIFSLYLLVVVVHKCQVASCRSVLSRVLAPASMSFQAVHSAAE